MSETSRDTHSSTEVRTAMGTVSDDAQRGLVTLLLAVELATFLGWHVRWRESSAELDRLKGAK